MLNILEMVRAAGIEPTLKLGSQIIRKVVFIQSFA
jgi:hypothetical protein